MCGEVCCELLEDDGSQRDGPMPSDWKFTRCYWQCRQRHRPSCQWTHWRMQKVRMFNVAIRKYMKAFYIERNPQAPRWTLTVVCVFSDIGLTVSKTLILILQLANMLGVVDPRAIVKLDHFPTCEKNDRKSDFDSRFPMISSDSRFPPRQHNTRIIRNEECWESCGHISKSIGNNTSNIYWTSMAHLSKIHRTPIEIYRRPIEHISNIYRTTIERLSSIYRTYSNTVSGICRTYITHLSKINRTSIEHMSHIY